MSNHYDSHLLHRAFIPATVVQAEWKGDKKQIAIDKGVMDALNELQPISSALLIYLSVKLTSNHVVEFTMGELMNATGMNRTAIRRAVGYLMDADYLIPMRDSPASLMML